MKSFNTSQNHYSTMKTDILKSGLTPLHLVSLVMILIFNAADASMEDDVMTNTEMGLLIIGIGLVNAFAYFAKDKNFPKGLGDFLGSITPELLDDLKKLKAKHGIK